MKFYSALLALALVHNGLWETDAYTARTARRGRPIYSQGFEESNPNTNLITDRRTDYVTADRATSADERNREFRMDTTGRRGYNRDIWEYLDYPITVQGGSLRTWSFEDDLIERVGVFMRTDGRPLNTNVELWHGPDNTPQKMSVYIEDGARRSFNCVLETPLGTSAVAVRNTANMEFPLEATVEANVGNDWVTGDGMHLARLTTGRMLQGGAIQTYPIDPDMDRVQVLLHTDGRPLNARIELLQGPNNKKQVVECYTEDGLTRPFSMVIDTPGTSNVLRLVNTATMEYPITAYVDGHPVTGGRKPYANTSAAYNSNYNFNEFNNGRTDRYRRGSGGYGSGYGNGYEGRGPVRSEGRYGRGGYSRRGYGRGYGSFDSDNNNPYYFLGR